MIAMGLLTKIFAVLSAMSGITLLVLVYLDHRNSRIDDSIAAFRRHIDALSPESRRSTHSNNSDGRDGWYR